MKVGDMVVFNDVNACYYGIVLSERSHDGVSYADTALISAIYTRKILWCQNLPKYFSGTGLVREVAERLVEVVE